MAKKKIKNKKGFVAGVTALLEGALTLSHAFERLLVDVVAAYVPLLAPVIPAYLAFHNLYFVLTMPLWVSIIGALVVEFLGFATITTVVQFVDFNATKHAEDPGAPFYPAVGVAAFYLIVVLTVNVLLDDSEFIERFSKLLMSTLSVAGAVTISLRGQHSVRLEAKMIRDAKNEAEKKSTDADERAYKRQVAKERRDQKFKLKKMELQVAVKQDEPVKVSEKVSESVSEKPATFGKWKTWRKVPHEEKLKIVRMTVEQVMETYGVDERSAYNWLKYARRDEGMVGEVAQFQEELVSDLASELSNELFTTKGHEDSQREKAGA